MLLMAVQWLWGAEDCRGGSRKRIPLQRRNRKKVGRKRRSSPFIRRKAFHQKEVGRKRRRIPLQRRKQKEVGRKERRIPL